MIINFTSSDSTVNSYFTLCDNQSWTISVNQIVLTFPRVTKSCIYEVITNLICRTDGNESRVLFYIFLAKGTNHFTYQPTQNQVYKLRLHSFSESVFILRSSDTQQEILIKNGAFSFNLKPDAGIL